MPWLGTPTSYASGYMSAQRTSAESQSLTTRVQLAAHVLNRLAHQREQRLEPGVHGLHGHRHSLPMMRPGPRARVRGAARKGHPNCDSYDSDYPCRVSCDPPSDSAARPGRLRSPGRRNPMHVDLYIVLGSAVVGLLVGLTGAGGGALMTPMLILLFGITAVLRDLQRPGGRGADAAGRRRRAPAQGHGEPAPGRLDGARLGADGVRRLLPAAPARQQLGRAGPRSRSRSAPRCWSAPRPWCSATSWTGGPASERLGVGPATSPCGRCRRSPSAWSAG